jgi:uncharacterized protein (TIGR02246 family)
MNEIAALRREVARLADRDAVADIMSRFTAAMDSQDPDGFAPLFTEDIVIVHGGGSSTGLDQVVAGLKRAIGTHFTSHHMITNHRVALRGDTARAVCYFHSVHLDDAEHPDVHADHGGWYLLELVRSAPSWKIRRLKQVSIWSAEQRRPKGPLEPAILSEMREFLGDGA